MARCSFCGNETTNRPHAFYFKPADPTETTFLTICDDCQKPREQSADYAAPFADGDDEE